MSSLKSLVVLASATAAKAAVASAVDYVIVGGGPAGYVVAEMLSQNPSVTVALLEKGPDEINNTDVNSESLSSVTCLKPLLTVISSPWYSVAIRE